MGAAPARRRGGTLAMSEDSWAVELRQASGAFIEEEQRDFLRRSQAGDGNVELNAALLEWLQERGVWVSELSGWNVAPHKLALSSATIDEAEGETSGRGLLARDSVEEGKELFVIPIDLCITKAGAQAELGADVVPDTMNEFVAIALQLIRERALGEDSEWAPYMAVLPTTADVAPTFCWDEADLAMLEGSPIVDATQSMIEKLRAEHTRALEMAPAGALDPAIYTFEAWEWAFTMLFSRAIRLRSAQKGERLAMVPYADLINHSPFSSAYVDARASEASKPWPWSEAGDEVVLYADRAYKKFEQIFISYGQKSNAELLLLYGFALDRNPFNSVALAVGAARTDPLFEAKEAFAAEAGRSVTSVAFPLYLDRYPDEMLQFLRMTCVSMADLPPGGGIASLDYTERLSATNEAAALTAVAKACTAALGRYPTSEEDDTAIITDLTLFKMLSRRQRMATRLRRTEKRLLKRTIAAVERIMVRDGLSLDPELAAAIPAPRPKQIISLNGMAGVEIK